MLFWWKLIRIIYYYYCVLQPAHDPAHQQTALLHSFGYSINISFVRLHSVVVLGGICISTLFIYFIMIILCFIIFYFISFPPSVAVKHPQETRNRDSFQTRRA